ncbi:uncharacterized protein BDV17DRAFT_296765 [Aspergillus undulatus]|uniref:uncharacterized protein n=1 Tax=Aspergillus undulatus TaxID=1810928 RepID=UPI003CCC92D9
MSRVKELHNHAKDGTNYVPPRYEEVRICLNSAITSMKGLKQVYIVLDALDELPNEPDDPQRTKMLEWMAEVTAREPHVRILFTSRTDSDSGDIKHTMEAHPCVFRITIGGVSNRDNMRSYLTGQFRDINALRNLRHASQGESCGYAFGQGKWNVSMAAMPIGRSRQIPTSSHGEDRSYAQGI